MKQYFLFCSLLLTAIRLTAQSDRKPFCVDTVLKVENTYATPLIYNTTGDHFYYLKSYGEANTNQLQVMNYDAKARKIKTVNYAFSKPGVSEFEGDGIRSLLIAHDSLFILTTRQLYYFSTLANGQAYLQWAIPVFHKQARLYLPMSLFEGQLTFGRYSQPIPGKIPFLEFFGVDFKRKAIVSCVRQYDDLGQLYLNSRQTNLTCMGYGQIALTSVVDYEIYIYQTDHGSTKVSIDTLRVIPEGWISADPRVLKSLDAAYNHKPSLPIIDSMLLLEEKYISRINHIGFLDKNRLLVSYSINDTSASVLALPKNQLTKRTYFDIWEKQSGSWQRVKTMIEDAQPSLESEVTRNNFEMAFSFAEVATLQNKLVLTNKLPDFTFGETWRALNKRRYGWEGNAEAVPVVVVFSFCDIN